MSAQLAASAPQAPGRPKAKKAQPIERGAFAWCVGAVCTALLPLAPTLPVWFAAMAFSIVAIAALYGRRERELAVWLRLPLTLGAAGAAFFAYDFRFGRDTGGALLVAMLALKLFELRQLRDARSALSYALFAIVAAFLQDQSPRTFTLSLFATLVTLAALARISQVTPAPAPLRRDVPLRMWGAVKLLALSLPLAVVGFFLFPRLANPLWGLPGNVGQARTGLSDEMAPGDIVALFSDDSPAMRVQFQDAAPPQAEMYWRGPVLTNFNGRTWSRWPGSLGFSDTMAPGYTPPRPEPLGRRFDYEIVQEPTDRRYLVALDMPLAPPEGMRMAYDGTIYAPRAQTELSRYRAASVTRHRFEPRLLKTFRDINVGLPRGFNPRTAELMAQWKAEDPSPAALARRALQWFNAEFTYTLEPEVLGRNSADDFLFNTREGYCEHFASAFTVMMRMADIPARVVTGYQGARHNTLADYWVVRHSDAHAWSEIWLEDRGWVRIDPTSAVAPERIERGSQALDESTSLWAQFGSPLFNASDWLRRTWNDMVLGFNAAQQRNLLQQLGMPNAGTRELGLSLAVGAGLALALTVALLLRAPRDRRDALQRAYARFLGRLARAGAVKPASEPPLDFAARAALLLPQAGDAVIALSRRYAHRRYAAVQSDPHADAALCDELRAFRVPRRRGVRRSA